MEHVHKYTFVLVVCSLLMDKSTSLGCGSHTEYLVSGQRGIPDSGFSASSSFPNGGNLHDPIYARLFNYKSTVPTFAAWSSYHTNKNQYIKVAFNSPMVVCAVLTQGRQNKNQWVTSYTVTYSSDDTNWVYVTNSENEQIFQGNADRATVVKHSFLNCVEASFMRINPQTWTGHISIRVDFQGCSKTRSDYVALRESSKIRVWKRSTDKKHRLTQISKETTAHLGSCCIRCHQTSSCKDYTYSPSDNTCTLYSMTSSTTTDILPGESHFYSPNIGYLAKSYDFETKFTADNRSLYYRITAEKKTQIEATTSCASDFSRLIVINNTEDASFIQQEIRENLILTQETEYFVNGEHDSGKWVFDTKEEIPASLWAPSQPQTNDGTCVVITEIGLQTKDCNSQLYFVCELW